MCRLRHIRMRMSRKNNLVKNASFLMIAAMISKIIGLLYKSPLSSIVGNVGMGYVSIAQNAYMILLMIASFSIPQAVSKLISERIAFRDYKNAQRIFRGSMIYAVVVGGIVALFCLFGASFIIPSDMADATLALQILAPTIFLSGILGVYRGYFQAFGNMMPTSISQILEQIINAIVSIVAAWLFIDLISNGKKAGIAKWGAAGSTVGTGAGVLVAFLFMLLVYGINRRGIRRRIESDKVHKAQPYKQIFKTIILIVSPIILSAFVFNVNTYLNSVLFAKMQGMHNVDSKTISTLYAEYSSYFMSIINIPLTLTSAAPTSMIPEISALYAQRNFGETRGRINQTMQLSMFIAAPCAVGLAVLAHPIVSLLFPVSTGVAGDLLVVGAFSILLTGISNISNGVLQGIGKPNIPLITAAVALGVDIVAVVLMLRFTNLGVYSLLIATVLYSLAVCVMNDIFMKKYLQYKNPWLDAYLKPVVASIPMGVVAWGIYHGLYLILPVNIICLIVAIPLAAMVYVIGYIFIAKVPEEQIRAFPCGALLVKVGRVLRIY